jgi:excisionase family DNA binding protein
MGASREGRKTVGEALTIEELAVYLKIANSTLYKLARERRVPAQKVGRRWRFRKESIDRWLEHAGSSTGQPLRRGDL